MKISVKEYIDKHNKVLNRRGKPFSEGYLYRLIRQDIAGTSIRPLWFDYVLEGAKDRIYIVI